MQKWINYLIRNVNILTWNRLGHKHIVVGKRLLY